MPTNSRQSRQLIPRHGTGGVPAALCIRDIAPRRCDPAWAVAGRAALVVDRTSIEFVEQAARGLAQPDPNWLCDQTAPSIPPQLLVLRRALIVTLYDWDLVEGATTSMLVRRSRVIPTRAAASWIRAEALGHVVDAFWSAERADLGDDPTVPIPQAIVQRVCVDQAHGGCANAWCPRPGGRAASLTVERIVSVDNGGSDDRDNLHVICSNCHRRRGPRPWGAFVEDEQRRAGLAASFTIAA